MASDIRDETDARLNPADIMSALRRAARRAHEIARATGTKVVVHVDGKTVEMEPNPEMFDDLDPVLHAPVSAHGSGALGKIPS